MNWEKRIHDCDIFKTNILEMLSPPVFPKICSLIMASSDQNSEHWSWSLREKTLDPEDNKLKDVIWEGTCFSYLLSAEVCLLHLLVENKSLVNSKLAPEVAKILLWGKSEGKVMRKGKRHVAFVREEATASSEWQVWKERKELHELGKPGNAKFYLLSNSAGSFYPLRS